MKWILKHWWLELLGLVGLAGSAAALIWLGKYLPHGATKDFAGFLGSLLNKGAEHAPAVHAKTHAAAKGASAAGLDSSSLQAWFASANAMAAASAMAVLRRIIRLFFWWLKVIAFLIVLGGVAAAAYFLGGYGKV
jgi:hypothetical protein